MALQYFRHELKPAAEAESDDGCFDCNICLDFATEPVVTLCGHLYCWPCIYKWLHVQSASLASDEHPQCPVCKADICHTAMVPLYARGQPSSGSPDGAVPSIQLGMLIPPRPSACAAAPRPGQQQLPYRNPYQNHSFYHHQGEFSPASAGAGAEVGILHQHQHPVVGMFRGMVYARAFGNSEGVPNVSSSSYRLMGSGTSRTRRQEMQAEKSLNRVSIFLFCCLLLCLLVF